MRNVIIIIAILLTTSCGKDCFDIERSNLVCNDQCEHEEYHATCLENGECFNSLSVKGKLEKGDISIIITNTEQNQYGSLYIIIKKNKISCDTLYLAGTLSFLQEFSFVNSFFTYSEDDQLLGSFRIPTEGGTNRDFVIIDYVNKDTTEIAGRFQVEFTERSVGFPIDIPPSMAITCGSFRVIVEE